MSDYQRRFEAAETELAKAGIWPSNAVPPYIRAMQKLGLTPVLPHYKPLWQSFAGQTVFFTLLIGVVTFSTLSDLVSRSVMEVTARALLIGTASGLIMVFYYASCRRKYGLSRWEAPVAFLYPAACLC